MASQAGAWYRMPALGSRHGTGRAKLATPCLHAQDPQSLCMAIRQPLGGVETEVAQFGRCCVVSDEHLLPWL